jgi:hypothetical protein
MSRASLIAVATAAAAAVLSACGSAPAPKTVDDPQTGVRFTLTGRQLTVDATRAGKFLDAVQGQPVLVQCLHASSYEDMKSKLRGQLATTDTTWNAGSSTLTVTAPGANMRRDVCVVFSPNRPQQMALAAFSPAIRVDFRRDAEAQQKARADKQTRERLNRVFDAALNLAVEHGGFRTATFLPEDLAAALAAAVGTPVTVVDRPEQVGVGQVAVVSDITRTELRVAARSATGDIYELTGLDTPEIIVR